tara:strand:+ start:196 stop:1125 length:930 start_codon:yes stop_codon:yes gene_type:complete
MKYIVTGGAGFIGSNLVDKLLYQGHEIVVIDNLACEATRKRMESKEFSSWNTDNPIFINQDIVTMSDFSIFDNAHGMFHLAALPRVQPSIKDPIRYHSVNVNGTLNMLFACKEMGIKRFVFSSSSAVYGNVKILPISESSDLNPLSPYGLHKLIGEQYCKLFDKIYNMETYSLRYFNVFGPRQPLTGSYSLVIGKFANQLLNNLPLTINGDGEQRRDFVYVGDVVDANIACMNIQHYEDNIINIGSGYNTSVNEIANMLSRTAPRINEPPVIEPPLMLADITKANEYLKWSPVIKLNDWINNYKKDLGL